MPLSNTSTSARIPFSSMVLASFCTISGAFKDACPKKLSEAVVSEPVSGLWAPVLLARMGGRHGDANSGAGEYVLDDLRGLPRHVPRHLLRRYHAGRSEI